MSSSPPTLSGPDACQVAALYDAHQPWLLTRLQQRLRNRAEAEDVASETFEKVIRSRQWQGLQEPRAYLTTIAKHILLRQWRRRDLEQAYLDALAQCAQAYQPSVEERAILLESLERIATALQGLSEKGRAAFLMSQLDNLTYAEIAERLGISVSMVRKYMAQGLRQCVQALETQSAG